MFNVAEHLEAHMEFSLGDKASCPSHLRPHWDSMGLGGWLCHSPSRAWQTGLEALPEDREGATVQVSQLEQKGGQAEQGREGEEQGRNQVGRRLDQGWEGGGISSSGTANILSLFPTLICLPGFTQICASHIAGRGPCRSRGQQGSHTPGQGNLS